jgi:DNA polymerase-3 subunit alpha
VGFVLGDVDQIRKAVGKKIKAKIDEHRSKFVEGAVANGIEQSIAEAIYGDIEFFARYGFNKAHAADYALVTCQTAYLKAHYPVEYMAALLTVERNNTEKIGLLAGECRAMSIEVLPPNINRSYIDFTIEDHPDKGPAIRFSLSAIKNVGEGPIGKILEARAADGPFVDLDDFCRRVDLRHVGRRALEGLIKVGALDGFAPRNHLLAIIDRMINLSSSTHKATSVGQISMFDLGGFDAPQIGSVLYPEPENLEEIPRREILGWEKELAGTYLSDHPLQRHLAAIRAANATMLGEIDETMHGKPIKVVGLVNFVRPHQTKKGEPMAFVEIEDIQTTRELVIFPRTYAMHKEMLIPGNLVMVQGKVDAPEGRDPKILADTITTQITTYNAANEMAEGVEPPPTMPLFQAEPATPVLMEKQNGYHYEPGEPNELAERGILELAPPALSQPEREPVAPRPQAAAFHHLHITLPRTGNLTTDKHRLKTVYNLLVETPGNDRFFLYIPNGSKKIQIEFPHSTTHYTARLEQKLVQILGVQALRVD